MTITYRFISALAIIAGALFLCTSMVLWCPDNLSWWYDTAGGTSSLHPYGAFGSSCACLWLYLFGWSGILLIFVGIGFFVNYWWIPFCDADRLWAALGVFVSCMVLSARTNFEPFVGVWPGGVVGLWANTIITYFLGFFISELAVRLLLWTSLVAVFRFSWVYPLTSRVAQGARFMCRTRLSELLMVWLRVLTSSVYALYIRCTSAQEDGDVLDMLIDDVLVKKEEVSIDHLLNDPWWHDYRQKREALQAQQNAAAEEKAAATIPVPQGVEAFQLPPEKTVFVKAVRYDVPPTSIFAEPSKPSRDLLDEHSMKARQLEEKLNRFGVQGGVVSITPGPVVTLFEYQPAIDAKISTIIAREHDLALALQALSLRIIAPIPGKSVVGFEVANLHRKPVLFSDLIRAKSFTKAEGALPLILGKDTQDNPLIVDLASLPHVLVAGATGSGKSVALNAMLISLLCKKNPDEVRLILVDPKRLEFSAYAECAHLLFPIVTDPKKAITALQWAVATMQERYELMAQKGVRNIHEYRKMHGVMPYIVIVIDELADLMMTAGKDVEDVLARLAQMARAAGIHLIVATQRPSVDVITGMIKINFPARIAFKVTSKVDSRTILDAIGAEKLLGRGDMLMLTGNGLLVRAHGAFVSDAEIAAVVAHIKKQGPPEYVMVDDVRQAHAPVDDEDKELYKEVVMYLDHVDDVSISLIQRKFRIGYNRSARIIEALEAQGLIMLTDGGKTRRVVR